MRYIGPPILRATVHGVYDRVAGDYTRQDPLFVVGKIKEVRVEEAGGRIIPDREHNDKVNQAITEITSPHYARFGAKKNFGPEGAKKRLRLIGNLSDAEMETNVYGKYLTWADAIQLRSDQIFCLLIRNYMFEDRRFVLAQYLDCIRHELTHWEMGDSKPFEKVRRFGLASSTGMSLGKEAQFGIRKDIDGYGLQTQETVDGVATAAKALEDALAQNPSRAAAEFLGKVQMLIKAVDRLDSLGISLLNESVAYAVEDDVRSFDHVPADNPNRPAFDVLFRHFQDYVRDHSRREAIARAKAAMNESWDSDRHVTEVLGVTVG